MISMEQSENLFFLYCVWFQLLWDSQTIGGDSHSESQIVTVLISRTGTDNNFHTRV